MGRPSLGDGLYTTGRPNIASRGREIQGDSHECAFVLWSARLLLPLPVLGERGGERVHFRYRRQAREPNESARVVPYGSPHAPMKHKRRKSTRRAKPTRLPLLRYENVAAARSRAFRKHL